MQKKSDEKEQSFSGKTAFEKFNFIIDLPFDYARKITLPPCEPEKYSKFWATVFPGPGTLFMIFAAMLDPKPWWLYISIPVGIIGSAAIHLTSPADKPPKYYPLLELFGTIGALMWTYLVSGILIDLLQFLGMLSKLDKTYLGLTVIAVGNALPDGVTTIALAKQGYAMMGLTGAYGMAFFKR
jgi:sodium/potassium/calcium exchanger 6